MQNVGANTNVTFRIVNYGGTSSAGTWYIYDAASSSALDLALQGTVTQVLTPAIAPTISQLSFANNQFQFTLTGTAGSNYVVQAKTNLASTAWISIRTNVSPFVYVETNAGLFPLRFYRGLVGP